MENMNLRRQEQAAHSPAFARHLLPTSDSPLQSNDDIPDQNSIEVGSIYEIDHTHLPTRTPVQLRSIRVVIVSEKTEKNVTVTYPSLESLCKYFSSRMTEVFPSLEEKFTMGTKLAGKVLYREVSSQEFAQNVHLEGFWLVKSVSVDGLGDVIISKKDTILTSELKCNGMLRWGVCRQVKFLGKHREINNVPRSSSSFVTGGGKVKWEGDQKREDDEGEKEQEQEQGAEEEEEEEEKKGEEEDEDEPDVDEETDKNLKRKRYSFRSDEKAKKKKNKKPKPTYNTKSKNNCKQIVLKNPVDRWSAERYKSAENNLLEVMKAKEAVFGKPILRPALRAEARKKIGDTGLLDHLLKHMAGKVAPGGNERFRRRHNADGAMEYWLESADLVSIRNEAGVQDPYWTPPPGWKPGDCPTQDPICAKELKLLKDETSNIRRDMEEMVSKKQFEVEMARLRREMEEELVSMKKQQENQAIVVSNGGGGLCENTNSLVPSEYSNLNTTPALVTQLEKYKKQLMDISDTVRGMEEEIGKLTSKEREKSKAEEEEEGGGAGSELIVAAEKEKKKQKEEKRKAVAASEPPPPVAAAVAAEEKAEKIKRLKSGFRICKPQGTFLWPNMVKSTNSNSNNNLMSPQVVVQVEDLFMVPTPPSVSSSTTCAPPLLPYHHRRHHQANPVKPLAERRAVTVTVSKAPHSYEDGENNYSSAATSNSALINLNDSPASPGEGAAGCRVAAGRAAAVNSPSSSASCLSNGGGGGGVETWLALATPNPAAGDISRG